MATFTPSDDRNSQKVTDDPTADDLTVAFAY